MNSIMVNAALDALDDIKEKLKESATVVAFSHEDWFQTQLMSSIKLVFKDESSLVLTYVKKKSEA